jgi:AcrR family transcriptional regulator
MAEVKRRAYRSPLRTQRSEDTKARILDAARQLFLTRGYAGATATAIAARAGVSQAMLFAVFGTKAGVLQALIGQAVVGDDGPTPLADRPAWSEAVAQSDALNALGRFAAMSAAMQARSWRLIEVARAASDSDEAMAALIAQGAANRRADCRAFVEQAIAGNHRRDLTLDEAVDVLWLYTSADLYRLLVGMSGWSHDRYEAWLADTLATAILER